MRKLAECGSLDIPFPEVLSVLRLCAIDEPFFPNLETSIELWPITGEFVPFIPLFLSPRTTAIAIALIFPDSDIAMIASMITAFPALCPNLRNITPSENWIGSDRFGSVSSSLTYLNRLEHKIWTIRMLSLCRLRPRSFYIYQRSLRHSSITHTEADENGSGQNYQLFG